MPRSSNFSFVIDSSFNPFSFKEMVQPLAIYKEAYEQAENAYNDLTDKADTFKYLSEKMPEDSKARQIYEGYANELHAQAKDLMQHGLTMGNRRGLTNLKQRYRGEIGQLVEADTAMKQEQALRRTMNAKDASMLYATDNLNIDQFLNGATPNLYNISGTDLYTRAVAAGKAASSRVYGAGDAGKTLGGYYRDYVKKMGYTPEQLRSFGDQIANDFAAQVSVLPELQQAAQQILDANGATENLSGNNLRKAQQQVIRGLIDGSVYTEQHDPVRDPGVMSAEEKDASRRGWASYNLSKDKFNFEKATSGIILNKDGTVTYDPSKDAAYQRMKALSQEDMGDYWVNPISGKLELKKDTPAEKEDKALAKEKQEAFLQLGKKELGHNEGFDVTLKNNRVHYNYIGAISNHGGKWYHGALGDDNPGHSGWGMFSSSNVENAWGNFSAEGSDSKNMKVLAPGEIPTDEGLLKAIVERCQAAGVNPEQADIQIIEVPNEKDSRKKGYLIAVH